MGGKRRYEGGSGELRASGLPLTDFCLVRRNTGECYGTTNSSRGKGERSPEGIGEQESTKGVALGSKNK